MKEPKDRLLYMKYIGVLSLLGRVAGKLKGFDSELASAFHDANKYLSSLENSRRFEKASSGWALSEEGK